MEKVPDGWQIDSCHACTLFEKLIEIISCVGLYNRYCQHWLLYLFVFDERIQCI